MEATMTKFTTILATLTVLAFSVPTGTVTEPTPRRSNRWMKGRKVTKTGLIGESLIRV